MTTGIYKLEFSDGSFYIGQSINIEERWKQHVDKMVKGKAAAPVQQAYEKCGLPTGIVLKECHRNYLDALEALYIRESMNRRGCLNTTVPASPCDNNDEYWRVWHVESVDKDLNKSIFNLIIELDEIKAKLESSTALSNSISRRADTLQRQRTEEELRADVDKRIASLQERLAETEEESERFWEYYEEAKEQLNKLEAKFAKSQQRWFVRLFEAMGF